MRSVIVNLVVILAAVVCAHGGELLRNTDFQQDADNDGVPDHWAIIGEKQGFTAGADADTGTRWVAFANAAGEATLRQLRVKLDPASTYLLRAAVKSDGLDGRAFVCVVNGDWTWSGGCVDIPAGNSAWTLKSARFKPGPSPDGLYSVAFAMLPKAAGKASVSFVSLVELQTNEDIARETKVKEAPRLRTLAGACRMQPPPASGGAPALVDDDAKSSAEWGQGIDSAQVSVDLGAEHVLTGLILTEIVGDRARLDAVKVEVSMDGNEFRTVSEFDNRAAPVAAPDAHSIVLPLRTERARVVRLGLRKTLEKMTLCEVNLYGFTTAEYAPRQAAAEKTEAALRRQMQLAAGAMLKNPSFELASADDPAKPLGWEPATHAEAGQKSAPKMTWEGGGCLDSHCIAVETVSKEDWGEWISAPVELQPDKFYCVSFVFKVRQPGLGPIEVLIDGNDFYINEQSAEWTPFGLAFKKKPTDLRQRLALVLYHRAGQKVWFDHVTLTEVHIGLQHPADQAVIADETPQFAWTAPVVGEFTLELCPARSFPPDALRTFQCLGSPYTPAAPLPDGTWFWRVKEALYNRKSVWEKPFDEALSEVRSFKLERQGDNTPPVILSCSPARSASLEPAISIRFEEFGGRPIKAELALDGHARKVSVENGAVTAVPETPLEPGEHSVSATLTDEGGNQAEASWRFYCYSEPPRVLIKDDLALEVDGKPFFPLGFYSPVADAALFKELGDNGYNALQHYGLAGMDVKDATRFLDEAAKAGLSVILGTIDTQHWDDDTLVAKASLFAKHPAVLGWYTADEPSADPAFMLARARTLKKCSPLPLASVHCVPRSFSVYAPTTDIFMIDPYVLFKSGGGAFDGSLEMIPGWMQQAHAAVGGKSPVWVVPNAFRWPIGPEGRIPTYREERAMTYLGLCHGAKGVIYYAIKPSYDHIREYPGFWLGMMALGRELAALSPLFLAPGGRTWRTAQGLHCLEKQIDGDFYLICVNPFEKPVSDQVRVTLVKSATAAALGEDRKLEIKDGLADEELDAAAVHIYTTAAAPPRIPVIAEIEQAALAADLAHHETWKDNVATFYNGAKTTVSAEASYVGYNSPMAIDRIKLTHWAPQGATPHWLEIAFAKNEKVDTVKVWAPCYPDFDRTPAIRPISYRLLLKVAGEWKPIASVENNSEACIVHKFEPIEAAAARLEIKSGASIAEFEVFRAAQAAGQ